MSITIDSSVPPNTESPRNGATRIRNLAAALQGLIGLPTSGAQTVGGPFIVSFDPSGNPTFPSLSQVAADPTAALGLATKQYVDAKVPFVVATGGDSYVGTFADIPSLVAGQLVNVKFPIANTGTSPTFNLNSTGAVPIAMVDGTSPAVGVIKTGGIYELVFDAATATWVLAGQLNSTSVFPLQTDVSANSHRITNLAAPTTAGDALSFGAFTGVNASTGSMSFQLDIGGSPVTLTLNWGVSAPQTVNANSNSGAVAVSFATAFTSACFSASATATQIGGAGANGCTVSIDNSSITTAGFSGYIANTTGTNRSMGFQWFAVGH